MIPVPPIDTTSRATISGRKSSLLEKPISSVTGRGDYEGTRNYPFENPLAQQRLDAASQSFPAVRAARVKPDAPWPPFAQQTGNPRLERHRHPSPVGGEKR